ncbi:MAG: TIR domain-containing protein [Nitrospira sp.]|nr:TIR domain-containing protein [Nitrospira sp.]
MKRLVEEVFVTEGVPQFTFVTPPNYTEILLDIRRPGKPVVIEGQSGTGKTTCVKKILERLGEGASATYLTARDATHVSAIARVAQVPTAGTFVIDDFHRLAQDVQGALGDIAKIAAERATDNPDLPKLVLIGINQIGSDLIQLVPDIAKRTGIHRIQPGTAAQIQELINAGCKELNITFENAELIFSESRGDYWLTQQLCQSACALNGVTETCAERGTIGINLPILRQRVVDRLKAAYYPAVKELCRGQRFRPSNDPYYKLLRAVSEQDSSIVDLNELSNAKAEVHGSINNIKERRLSVLIQSKPVCARHFYYNSETKNFAIEDPALFYFLKHLDWNALRSDCGFREAPKDYEFDFAISFAGENRDLARHIAESLAVLDANVFFDEQYEANYLGRTWSKEFLRIFGSASRLVVCLLDNHHKDKIWPTFERECFEPRVADAEVIPIFLDDTAFPGIPKDTIGIKYAWKPEASDWQNDVIDNIVYKLIERAS